MSSDHALSLLNSLQWDLIEMYGAGRDETDILDLIFCLTDIRDALKEKTR